MLGSILSFSPELADRVSDYCEKHSEPLPKPMHDHWERSTESFGDADKMSSKLQAQFFIWISQFVKPRRILEVGCYSGFSAVAWYEGTKQTGAEIVTLELSSDMIRASRKTFDDLSLNDRVKLIEGPAAESIEGLDGTFDLIFIDANKDGYEGYVKQILDKKLLSADGIIICDNGMLY